MQEKKKSTEIQRKHKHFKAFEVHKEVKSLKHIALTVELMGCALCWSSCPLAAH